MDEGEEPPDRGKISTLVKTIEHHDSEGILFRPDLANGIIGYCNPTVIPKRVAGKGRPIFIRKRIRANNDYGEISVIDAGYMPNHNSVENLRTIIETDDGYAKFGVEDPNAVMDPEENIHLTGIGFDGVNPHILYWVISPDLENIQYMGKIGPEIPIRRAKELLGGIPIYAREIEASIEDTIKNNKEGVILNNKDASLYLPNRGVQLFGRFSPCIQVHTLRKDDSATNPNPLTTNEIIQAVKKTQEEGFWENEVSNLFYKTIIAPRNGQKKVGLGSAPVDIGGIPIGTYHDSLNDKITIEENLVDYWKYNGSFFKYDPTNKIATGKIIDSLLKPNDKEDRLKELHRGKLATVKDIHFVKSIVPMEDDPTGACIYSGCGDAYVKWRTTGIPWISKELDHPHNKTENWQRAD